MEHSFWHDKWQKKEIGFHQAKPHDMLVAHLQALNLQPGSRLFLPLCGKTLDIGWLLSQGYAVAGAELSEIAVQELFSELGVEPEIRSLGDVKHYHGLSLDIFVGDIFLLTAVELGKVDAVYDRAALVALPADMRKEYTTHIRDLTEDVPQLLITFEYDQSVIPGPPFSVPAAEVKTHYGASHTTTELHRESVAGGLKGQAEADETAWLIAPL
ncbi:MAG TPA: thiopurine S-methyltransferase [Oceanospirillales bacterium]|nr:thiopurine S-methyltransferase [Oceanospirillaceae bacterium]HBS41497.1 thiopurine S-methyltransferase [Oceanospirillales bacterium]|tara:strand:+ start:4140 stop:4778 length:639 start_codon:yes stop_codon:yes gene_type:complete